MQKLKNLKFGTKVALFGYFGYISHISNQYYQVCRNAKFHAKTKNTCSFGTIIPPLGMFTLHFEIPITWVHLG